MFRISDTHYAATWLLHPDAPKIDPPKSVSDRIERMKARASAKETEKNAKFKSEISADKKTEKDRKSRKAEGSAKSE